LQGFLACSFDNAVFRGDAGRLAMMACDSCCQRAQGMARAAEALCQRILDGFVLQIGLGNPPMAPEALRRACRQHVAKARVDFPQIVQGDEQAKGALLCGRKFCAAAFNNPSAQAATSSM
jgi:hypothetical protein